MIRGERGILLSLLVLAIGMVVPNAASALTVTDQLQLNNKDLKVYTGSRLFDNYDLHVATDDRLYLDAPDLVQVQNSLGVNNTLNVNRQGTNGYATGSKLYDDWDLHMATDDRLWLDAPGFVRVQNDLGLNGDLNIYRKGQQGMATGSSIYDSGNLHIATDDALMLDAPSYVKTQNDLKVGGDLAVTGDTTLGGSLSITGNFLPSADATYDLGSSSMKWKDLYLSGNTINLESGAVTISYDATAAALEIKNKPLSVGDGTTGGELTSSGIGDELVTSGLRVGNSTATTPQHFTQYDDGTLFVMGQSELVGNTLVDGSTQLGVSASDSVTVSDTGNFSQTGATTFSTGTGTVGLNGATTAGSTLAVTGLLSSNGGINADSGAFTVADTSGNVHTSGTLDVDSTSNFDGDVTLTGATTDLFIGGNLAVTGATGLTGLLTAASVDINGGAIDGTTIGVTTPSTGAFTTLSSTGVTTLGDNSSTVAINSSDWDIDATGAVTGIAFDANATGNSLSNVENADLVDDTLDFDKMKDAMTLDAATSVTGAAGNMLSVNRTLTDATNENGVVMTFTASDTTASSTGQMGLYLDNASSTQGLDGLLTLDNSDTSNAVDAAIKIVDAGGGFTNIFDNAGTLVTGANLNLLSGGITFTDVTYSGTLTATTVDLNGGNIDGTAIGATTPSTGVFTTVDTGLGAHELYAMDQNVQTTDAVTFATVDTGQGANELYDMDQNVLTTSDVTFNSVGTTAAVTVGTDLTVTSGARIGTGSTPDSFTALADDSLFVEGQLEVDGASRFDGVASFNDRVNLGAQTFTVTDDGTSNDTLTPTTSYVKLAQDATADVSDPDVAIATGSATDGDLLYIVRTDSNAGNVTITDTPGTLELGSTFTFASGTYDTLELMFVTDRWVRVGGSNN